MQITVVKGKDTTGKEAWYYNFFDDNRQNFNDNMTWLGRKTKRGIKSEKNPQELNMFFQYLIRTGKQLGIDGKLASAQKDIDACNNKNGCNAYCSNANQSRCNKLKKHAMLMSIEGTRERLMSLQLEFYKQLDCIEN